MTVSKFMTDNRSAFIGIMVLVGLFAVGIDQFRASLGLQYQVDAAVRVASWDLPASAKRSWRCSAGSTCQSLS